MRGSDPEHCWLVDPIDGTTNFINGMHYTISIALRRGDETVCGALYNPVADEMFTAIRGQGALLNGERLAVSAQREVGLMTVGTGLPTSDLYLSPGAYDRLEKIRDPIAAVRIVGSSANSCAYVACGRLTGYYRGIRPDRLGGRRPPCRRGRRHRHRLVGPWPGILREDRRGHRRQCRDPRLSHREAPRRPRQEPGLNDPQWKGRPEVVEGDLGRVAHASRDLAQAFCGRLALVLKTAVFDSLA